MADVKKMDVFLRTLEGLTARGVQRLDAIAEDKIEELQTIVEFAKNKTAKSEHVAMLSSVTKKPRTARRELLSLGITEADKENLENGVLTRRARMSRAAEATPLKVMDFIEVSNPSDRKRKSMAKADASSSSEVVSSVAASRPRRGKAVATQEVEETSVELPAKRGRGGKSKKVATQEVEEICTEPPAKRGRGGRTKKVAAAPTAPATPPAVHVQPERELHESPRPGVVQELTEFYETYSSPVPIRQDGISMVLDEITKQAEIDCPRTDMTTTKVVQISSHVDLAEPTPSSVLEAAAPVVVSDTAVLPLAAVPVAASLPKKTRNVKKATKLTAFLSQESSTSVGLSSPITVSTVQVSSNILSPLRTINASTTPSKFCKEAELLSTKDVKDSTSVPSVGPTPVPKHEAEQEPEPSSSSKNVLSCAAALANQPERDAVLFGSMVAEELAVQSPLVTSVLQSHSFQEQECKPGSSQESRKRGRDEGNEEEIRKQPKTDSIFTPNPMPMIIEPTVPSTEVEPSQTTDLMDIQIHIEDDVNSITQPLDSSIDLGGSIEIQANDFSFFSGQGDSHKDGVADDKLPNMSNLHSFIPLLKKTGDRPKSPIKQEVKALKAAAMKKTEEEKKMEERERRKALIAACKNRREQGQSVSAVDKEKELAKKAEDEKEKKRKEFEEAKRVKEEEDKVKKLEKKKKQEERLAQIKAEEEKRRKELEERRKAEEQERLKKEKEEEQRRKALKEQMERDRKKKEEEERARKEVEDRKKEEASRKKKEEEELARKAKLALQETEAAPLWKPPPVEESRMNNSKPTQHLPSALKPVYNSSVSASSGAGSSPLPASSSFRIGNAQAIPLSVDSSVISSAPVYSKTSAVSSSPLASAKPVASTTPGSIVPPVPLFHAAPQPVPSQSSVAAGPSAASKDELETYEISDKESDSEDDEEDPSKPKKKIPNWARSANVTQSLQSQLYIDPDTIFGPCPNTCSLEEIFQSKKSTYHRRGSSANWAEDRLTWREVSNYKKYMRFQPSTPGV